MRRCATTLGAEMTPEEHRLLLETLRSDHGAGTHLEIGTAAGGTLCTMLKAFTATSRPRFAVVDSMQYFPDQLEVVRKNLEQHGFDPKLIDFRVATSEAAFSRAAAAHESFDFVLIDGCHKICAVMSDLKWTRLVNVGGIVCLHDYSPKFSGVQRAVDRFLASCPNYERIGLAGSLLALRKTAMSPHPEVTRTDELYALAWHLPLQFERKWQKLTRAA